MDKLDILGREVFVDQLLRLVENISDNKASTCFAVNGSWGCGKSFVLDMLEERLGSIQVHETNADKYFVIRYNSWKFDYYDEPLVAIVATMISVIEEKTKLFPEGKEKSEILGMLKATGVALLSMASEAVKEKTGLDAQKAFETVIEGGKEGAAAYEDAHEYDVYFSLNKVIEKFALRLQTLAEKYTVVIMVDELDRCLPEYAIKVLERLHHLTEGRSNIITVVAIDKKQLMTSVKQIFGFENPERYLAKFFGFEVQLDCGAVSERISEKYPEYFSLFDKDIFKFEESFEECLQAIFKNVDIRTQEQLVNRSMLAHKLLFGNKKDYSFMCMEMLLAVMICVCNNESCLNGKSVNITSFESVFAPRGSSFKPAFAQFFKEQFDLINFRTSRGFADEVVSYILPDEPSLYGAIIYTWCWMHEKSPLAIVQHTSGDVYEPIAKNYIDLKKFAETIKMMK